MDAATRYADSDGVSIAYQVHGEGPVDLVFVSGFVSHVELFRDEPVPARLFRRLASFCRLILFDKREQGLSDRLGRPPTLEESVRDVRAVMDAVGCERAALLGVSEGGPVCELFASTYPERTSALVLYGTYARLARAPDYPQGIPDDVLARWAEMLRREWGGPVGIELWAPSAAHEPASREWWARLLRHGTSPRGAGDLMDLYREIDVRPTLATIRVPTLVLHRAGDRTVRAAHGRYLAEHIPDARYVELPGEDHLPMAGDPYPLVDEIEEFLVGTRGTRESERTLATVLFTDIVGSTERAAALGDRRWNELLAAHDSVVRHHLRVHDGTEIKTMGDGFLATFEGPARAIRSAREIVDRTRELGVAIRAGIHTGEVELTSGDIAGMAVNIGARVSALAGPGEVLVSSTVKELMVGSGIHFVDRGSHALKGVPGEWRLFAVSGGVPQPDGPVASTAEGAPAQLSLPPALAAAAAGPLVGREAELAEIRSAWEGVSCRAPRTVLLAGEPGIGKTRAAAEIAREAHSEGAVVLYGRCDEAPIGPYQPFVEALDRLAAEGALDLRAIGEAHVAELERLLPRLALDRAAFAPADDESDPEQARYRLFEAIRAAVLATMGDSPMLLVLDDLHWADRPTSSLLLHLVRGTSTEPLMLLGTYRDTAVAGPEHPLAAALSELRRRSDLLELSPRSLLERDVGDLVDQAGLGGSDTELPHTIHARTGGNPLFVVETLRDLTERRHSGEPGNGALPTVVRDVIDGRVARLGAGTVSVLRTAAVAGEQFELVDLEAAGDLDPDEVLPAVEAALRARLVHELPGIPGRYAFSHALVREALLEATSSVRRARIHLRLGEAQADRSAPAPAVAGHLLGAAPLGDPEAAADWTERAADDAAAAAAHEEAADLYRRALDRLALPATRRADLLIGLGKALDRSARRDEAREAFEAAAGLARELGDMPLLAAAALGHKGLGVTITAPDVGTVALLEDVLAAEGDLDIGLRARARAALALEIYYDDRRRSNALSAEAVELARSSGDRAALADALSARHASLWTAEGAVERLGVASEMRELARASGERVGALQARNWRVLDLLELGRVAEAEEEVNLYALEARALRLPRFEWYVPLWRAGLAIMRGDFELADRESAAAAELGRRAQDANADISPRIQRNLLLIEQRRFADLDLELLRERASRGPTTQAGWFEGAWLAALAWAHAELGQIEHARAAFEAVAAHGFAILPRDANWHAACDMAEACALLGDREAVPALLEILGPHASLNPVVGRGIGCYGPVDYFLGRLGTTAGDDERAVRHFERALAACEKMGARPRAALSRLRLGEAHAAGGDDPRGRREIEAGRRELESLGVRPP